MSLLEAQRRLLKDLQRRQHQTISEIVSELKQDLVHHTHELPPGPGSSASTAGASVPKGTGHGKGAGGAARGIHGKAPKGHIESGSLAAASLPEGVPLDSADDGFEEDFGFDMGEPAPSVEQFAERHAEACRALFDDSEKQTNVREIVRGITMGDTGRKSRAGKGGGKDQCMFGFSPFTSLEQEMRHFMVLHQRRKRREQQRQQLMHKPKRMALHVSHKERREAKKDAMESFQLAMLGQSEGSEDMFNEQLAGNSASTAVRHVSFVAWAVLTRRSHFERKRRALQVSLIWDDAERAQAVLEARRTLMQADQLSWFCVNVRNTTSQTMDARRAFPLVAPPLMRQETCDDFSKLAETLRQQLATVIWRQHRRLSVTETDVVENWLMVDKAKDTQKSIRQKERAKMRLENTKRQLAQVPAFLTLFEQMYVTCLVRSVENAAVFLSQIFADTSCLQIRVMAVPALASDDEGSKDVPPGSSPAKLIPCPAHTEVQTHLNSLLQSVVEAALFVLKVCKLQMPDPNIDPYIANMYSGAAQAASVDNSIATLQQYLLSSSLYRQAIESLDQQISRSFRALEQRLSRIRKQFGPALLTRVAVLSALYTDRAGLAKMMWPTSPPDAGAPSAVSPAAAAEGGGSSAPLPQECHLGSSTVRNCFVADFVFFWFAGPHAQLGKLQSVVDPLIMSAAQAYAESPDMGMEVAPLPIQIARRLSPGSVGAAAAPKDTNIDCTIFYSSLQQVAQGSTCIVDTILQQLLRLAQHRDDSLGVQEDMSITEKLSAWFQSMVDTCHKWQESVRDMRVLYQCGPFALDMKYLTFVSSQVAPGSLGLSIYLLNLYALNNGTNLWRKIQSTYDDVCKTVTTISELVHEMVLLNGIYTCIADYHAGRKHLERHLQLLNSAVRSPMLSEIVARLMGQHVKLDDHKGKSSLPGAQNPGGSLSTGALFNLVKRIDEMLGKLEEQADAVVATKASRVIPFSHRVQDEVMTVNASARMLRAEMEETLEPSEGLAIDARCLANPRAMAPEPTPGAIGDAALDVENPLTVGRLRSYTEIDRCLADFEERCEELITRRRLILEFESLAMEENISLSVPVVSMQEILLQKLSELRVFWRSAQAWDSSVNIYLQLRPDHVRIKEVQRQAHQVLQAVRCCPLAHQILLRQRVDSFRRLLQPLFFIQALLSLSPSRNTVIVESHAVQSRRESMVDPANTRRRQTQLQNTRLTLNAELTTLTPLGVEGVGEQGDKGPGPGVKPASGEGEQDGSPLFTADQNHIWQGLFGGTSSSPDHSIEDITAAITNLYALIRTGALYRKLLVMRHYDLAMQEMEVVGKVLEAVGHWSFHNLPISRNPANKALMVASGGAVLRQMEDHLGIIDGLLNTCEVYEGAVSKESVTDALAADTPTPPLISQTYFLLSREWRGRLEHMKANFTSFLECQEEWLKMFTVLRTSSPPDGRAGELLREADEDFRSLMAQMAAKPNLRHCLEHVLGDESLTHISRTLAQARKSLVAEMNSMRKECPRLFFIEDNMLLQLWGYQVLGEEHLRQRTVNAAVPKLFPGWRQCGFQASVDGKSRILIVVEAMTLGGGTPLAFRMPVALSGLPSQWVTQLEEGMVTSFMAQLQVLVPFGTEQDWAVQLAKEDLRESRPCSEEHEGSADDHAIDEYRSERSRATSDKTGDGTGTEAGGDEGTPVPDHVLVTAERIKWSWLLETWGKESFAHAKISDYVARCTKQLLGGTSKPQGASICFMLACRDALDNQERQDDLEALRTNTLMLAWKSSDHLVVHLDRLTFYFGWELYGGAHISCPVSEKYYVKVAQQLATNKGTLLQGDLGGTVTQSFASVCGLACHQLYVVSNAGSLADFFQHLLGAGLRGHWTVLQGVDSLEDTYLDSLLKHLATYFDCLARSIQQHHKKVDTGGSPLRGIHAGGKHAAYLNLPPGAISIRDTLCKIDKRAITVSKQFNLLCRQKAGRVALPCATAVPQALDGEVMLPLMATTDEAVAGARNVQDGSASQVFVPEVVHPLTAVFVSHSKQKMEKKSVMFRIAAFPSPDFLLYIQAGLAHAEVFNADAARVLSNAFTTFNAIARGGPPGSSMVGRYFNKKLGIPEVRSVCTLAASLRRARASQVDSQVNDHILLCDAWLSATSTVLDASVERELLWHCTVSAFGRSPSFSAHEANFRQSLFSDTLVAQRSGAKKDLSARLYDHMSDALKEKYSFFNAHIVQKCLATSQALLQQRHAAVVGEAGAGKTDLLVTLLDAGRRSANEGRPLFPDVQLLRLNTRAHDVHRAVKVAVHASRMSDSAEDGPPAAASGNTWLVLDGPLDAALLENISSTTPVHLLDADPQLTSPLPFRVLVETDEFCTASPSIASGLAITFIDSHRGPTWKDRAVAWSHQVACCCPDYKPMMELIRELLVQLMDSILAFVFYYFHAAPRDGGAVEVSAEADGGLLDYKHQTTSFLSFFTSLLIDPVIEGHLFAAHSELDSAPLEKQVRLLIGMSSISSFGLSLLTHQRQRFERYIRERVLDSSHAESLPPLYDLYFDSKTGTFQAVNEIVRLTEPIIDSQSICVATEEFVAFQLRLRRLIAIDAPVMLAGTAGSGKSTLLQYLTGSPSPALVFVLFRVSGATSQTTQVQEALLRQLRIQDGGFLAPPTGKRMVLLLDDLHMGNSEHQEEPARGAIGGDASRGSQSSLVEWMRFALEHRGFYNAHDTAFVPFRDASFLPSLLSPDSQNLQTCKRFSRHFFVVFMEIPSQESISKILSTVLQINFTSAMPTEVVEHIASAGGATGRRRRSIIQSTRHELLKLVLESTLTVCKEAELAARQRLHGLARVIWGVSHTFALVPPNTLASVADIGFLWAYAMRTFVLDAFLQGEQAHRRRHICSAIVRICASVFGVSLGNAKADDEKADPDAQAAELDRIAFRYLEVPAAMDAQRPFQGICMHRLTVESARSILLEQLTGFAFQVSTPGRSHSSEAFTDVNSEVSAESTPIAAPADIPFCGITTAELQVPGPALSPPKSTTPAESIEEPAGFQQHITSCLDILAHDGMAASMWLRDDTMLCTLLRLCHVMYIHPVVSLVGGWAHLPLLTLVSRLFGGGDIRLCAQVDAAAMERELMDPHPTASKKKSSDAAGTVVHTLAAGSSKDSESSARPSTADSGSQGPALTKQYMRVLAIGEDDVLPGPLSKYLDRQRSKYFRGRMAGSGTPPSDSPGPSRATSPVIGAPPSTDGSSASATGSPQAATARVAVVATPVSVEGAEGAGDDALQEESSDTPHTCVAVICRSAASLQALATRCNAVQQVLAATFVLPLQAGFQQIAACYLQGNLEGLVPYASLPKPRRSFMLVKRGTTASGSRGMSRSASKESFKRSGSQALAKGANVEAALWTPLSQATALVHQRIQECLTKEYGKEFGNEFCSPYRYSAFLKALCRLAQHRFLDAEQRVRSFTTALETLTKLKALHQALDTQLRSVRVAQRLLVEEANRLTTTVARLSSQRRSLGETLASTQKQQRSLKARTQAVRACFQTELSRARLTVVDMLRELARLETKHYTDLGSFIHPPPSIVMTLQVMHTVILYLRKLEVQTRLQEEAYTTAAAGDSAAAAAAAHQQPAAVAEGVSAESTCREIDVDGIPEVALAICSQGFAQTATRDDQDMWCEVVATKDILGTLQQWTTQSTLPPWLANVIDRYVTNPVCQASALWELSPAAARMSSWLAARLECHRILHKMETKLQSMGDLSFQMSSLQEEIDVFTGRIENMDRDLVRLKDEHTKTVHQREEHAQEEKRLNNHWERVKFILGAFDLRKRECEINVAKIEGSHESAEQWGLLLMTAALIVYSVAFNPSVRIAVSKEVRGVLREHDVPVPKDFDTDAYLKRFLPNSYLQMAQAYWPDKFMLNSAVALELLNSRCSIIFDPFKLAVGWLQEVHGRRFPQKAWAQVVPGPDRDTLKQAERKGQLHVMSQLDDLADKVASWEEDLPEQGGSASTSARAFAEGNGGLKVIAGDEPAPSILEHVQRCMRDCSTLIIELQEMRQLEGFVGALLIQLETAHRNLSIGSATASGELPLRTGPGSDAEYVPPLALIYEVNQRLDFGLPLPYRRFKLFVLVPQCPWNAVVWGQMRQKRAQQLEGIPSKLWSVCSLVSLDPRPVHPARMFLPALCEAAGASAAIDAVHRHRALTVQRTRSHLVEELLLEVLLNANHAALDGVHLHATTQLLHGVSERLSSSVALGAHSHRLWEERALRSHLPFAGTAAVLLCALMDAEEALDGGAGSFQVMRLNACVDGFALAPEALRVALCHQLRCASSQRTAVSALLELLITACSERKAVVFRVMLLLQQGLVRDKRLAQLWDTLVRSAFRSDKAEDSQAAGAAAGQAGDGKEVGDSAGGQGAQGGVRSGDSGKEAEGERGQAQATRPGSKDSNRSAPSASHSSNPGELADHKRMSERRSNEFVAEAAEKLATAMADEAADEFHEGGSSGEGSEEGSIEEGSDSEDASEGSEDGVATNAQRSGVLASDDLLGGGKGSVGEAVRELCELINAMFPARSAARDARMHLKLLPPKLPLLVAHDAIPMVKRLARQLKITIKEASSIGCRDADVIDGIFETRDAGGTRMWLLLDFADITNFHNFSRALRSWSEPVQQPPTSIVSRPGQYANLARPAPRDGDDGEAPRLILFSSSETKEVPRYFLRQCLCIQNAVRFFWSPAEKEHDRPLIGEELRTASPYLGGNDADAGDVQVPSPCLEVAGGARVVATVNSVTGLGGGSAAGLASGSGGHVGAVGLGSTMSLGGNSDRPAGHVSRGIGGIGGAGLAGLAGGLGAGSGGNDPSSGQDDEQLKGDLAEIFCYTHPVLTAYPLAMHDKRFTMAMRFITGVFAKGPEARLPVHLPRQSQQWAEEHVVRPAFDWAQKSAVCSLVASFSPTLIRQDDREVKDTLRSIAGSLGNMQQRISIALLELSAESPFWLRLELKRLAHGIQEARTDITSCYGAVQGDVHWNARIFAVYISVAHGRALWAQGLQANSVLPTHGRPLGAWLTCLDKHVTFLVAWAEAKDTVPLRIGSVGDLGSFFSSYTLNSESFHLRLEPRHPEKKDGDAGIEVATPARISSPWDHAAAHQHAPHVSAAAGLGTGTVAHTPRSALSQEGSALSEVMALQLDPRHAPLSGFLVESLRLIAGSWRNNSISATEGGLEYETELPPMVIRLVRGPMPKSGDVFACPLVIAHTDAQGTDLASMPVTHIMVRTCVPPALCAIRGVRLVSYV